MSRDEQAAATPEGDTIRTALQGAMVGEWGRENALAALALLEKQNAQLRAKLAEYDKYVAESTRHA